MDSSEHIMTCHIKLENKINIEDTTNLKNDIRKILKSYKINHSTIEFDV